MSQRALRGSRRTAHGPPKVERLGEEIMHSFNGLVRDRTQNRMALLLIALSLDVPPWADRHLIATNLYGG
jgi:hypothetical protein